MKTALPQPDFLRPVARPGRLAWAWCGTGLLVLAVSAADSHAAWQARQQALDQIARVPRATAVLPAPGPATDRQPGAGRSPAQARQAEAARWLAQLAQPWPVVWAASEAAAEGVQWLQLDHGPAGLRLTGLASSPAPAEAAADALRAQQLAGAAVWRGVTLAAIERVPEGQRFELVARLAAGVDPAAVPRTLASTPRDAQ